MAGTGALTISIAIAVAIIVLLGIVGLSYYQTIHAYPMGGGTYVVTKDNLGSIFSLVAGAALLVDYILTVAVSVAAGVAALFSWVPGPAALPRRNRRGGRGRHHRHQSARRPRVRARSSQCPRIFLCSACLP